MKKITILMVILMLSCMQMIAQGYNKKGTITLSHQGKESSFGNNQIAAAVSAAADGDTIYLSAGFFDGDVIIDKKLVFIGSGADEDCSGTNFLGRMVIKMPENTKLTARLFEGIHFAYYGDDGITFQNTIENVVFKKCSNMWCTINGEIKSILYDRCLLFVDHLFGDTKIKKIIARNCDITSINVPVSLKNEVIRQCFNCNIQINKHLSSTDDRAYSDFILDGEYTNCIINNGGHSLYDKDNKNETSSAVFTNCLFMKPEDGADIFNGASVKNNMFYESTGEDDVSITKMTKEQLQAYGFLGNDGTVVGYWGGKNPYSLKMISPAILSHKIHLDKEMKQIQMKMKVSLQ